jgi:probable addiction module antidote protein
LIEQLADVNFAAEYLNEAHRTSRSIFLKALRNVAEARRMAVVARQAGVNRETLYRTLSADGNPSLETYEAVLRALGLEYDFKPKPRGKRVRPPATANRKVSIRRAS